MEEIVKGLKEVIEKNLPKQTGEVLQQRLAQADKAEFELKEAEKQIEKMRLTIEGNNNTISQLSDLKLTKAKLDAQAAELDKKQNQLKVDELTYQLAAEKEKTAFAKEVALGLVRNIEYRKDVFDNENKPFIDQNGYTQYANTSKNVNEIAKAQ